MATIDLWIEGDWSQESAVFHQEVYLDMQRFHEDERYHTLISEHIERNLANLVKELDEIGISIRLIERRSHVHSHL